MNSTAANMKVMVFLMLFRNSPDMIGDDSL
jgi:hypothetical protein